MERIIIVILCFVIFLGCGLVWADEIDDIIPFVIQAESGGNPNAVSKAGAVGLCQITPIVLREYIENNPTTYTHFFGEKSTSFKTYLDYNIGTLYNPEINAMIGEWYLRRLRDHYLKDVIITATGQEVWFNKYWFKIHITTMQSNKLWEIENQDWWYGNIIRCGQDYKLALILSAYNGGITRLRKVNYDINKMTRETRNYVRKAMKLYKETNNATSTRNN